MATATKKARTATATGHTVRAAPGAASVAFLTYRDNGDNYHWEIVDASGEALARSGSFVSQDDAERAARNVCEGVRSADFEPHVVEGLRAVAS
jgi:uncharacterized protein YegP (UPF0339 family)